MGRCALVVALLAACGRIDFDVAHDAAQEPIANCVVGANLQVSNAAGASRAPALAGNGNGFALVWSDNRDGNFEIYLSTFDAIGTPLVRELRVTDTAAASVVPSIGWSGTSYAIVWGEDLGNNTYQSMFQELAAGGTPIGAATPLGQIASGFVPSRAQRWIDTSYALAWQASAGGNDEIFFARVSNAGAEVIPDTQLTMAAGGSGFPSLAWSGSEFGVAWNDDRDGNNEIYFARVTATGQKLTGDVRVTTAPDSSFAPGLERAGDHYLLTWWDNRSGTSEIYVRALDDSGAPLSAELQPDPGQYGQVAVARWSGAELGVIWADFRNGILEPYFARLDATGARLGDDQRVSTGGLDIELDGHDLAWIGARFAIAWGDKRSGDPELYVAIADCR
jgi:large repetitive protein